MARLFIRYETLPTDRVIVRDMDGNVWGSPKGYAHACYAHQYATKAIRAIHGNVMGEGSGCPEGFEFGFYIPDAPAPAAEVMPVDEPVEVDEVTAAAEAAPVEAPASKPVSYTVRMVASEGFNAGRQSSTCILAGTAREAEGAARKTWNPSEILSVRRTYAPRAGKGR